MWKVKNQYTVFQIALTVTGWGCCGGGGCGGKVTCFCLKAFINCSIVSCSSGVFWGVLVDVLGACKPICCNSCCNGPSWASDTCPAATVLCLHNIQTLLTLAGFTINHDNYIFKQNILSNWLFLLNEIHETSKKNKIKLLWTL